MDIYPGRVVASTNNGGVIYTNEEEKGNIVKNKWVVSSDGFKKIERGTNVKKDTILL